MQIAILVYPGFTALDIVGPYEVLRMLPDAEIRFVWTEPGPIVADSGVLVLAATHSFDETPAPDLVLVGGSSTSSAVTARNPEVREWLQRVHTTTQWTVSVCTGSLVLAGAGLLDGVPATCHWGSLPILTARGAQAVGDQRIVRSGKIVTGAGVSAGIDVALWLVGEIAGPRVAQGAQLAIEYDPQPPFDSGSTAKASPEVKRSTAAIFARGAKEVVTNEPGAIPREVAATSALMWEGVLARVRARRHGRRRIATPAPVS